MKKKLLWMKLTIGVLVAGLLLAGGYFSARVLKKEEIFPPTLTPTISATPTPSVILVNTTGWKTYTNTRYGYSHKYPPYFGVDRGPDPKNEELYVSQGADHAISTIDNLGIDKGKDYSVSIFIDADYGNVHSCIDEKDCEKKTLNLLGLSRDKYEIVHREIGNREVAGFLILWDKLKSETYHIADEKSNVFYITVDYSGYTTEEESTLVNPIIDAILGTFRFTK